MGSRDAVSLAGHCLLAGLLTVKVYRVLGKKGRKRPMLEATIMEVAATPVENGK